MLGNIQVSNLSPTPPINLVMVWRTLVFIILTAGSGLMRRTVAAFAYSLRTAGVSAGFERFLRHGSFLLRSVPGGSGKEADSRVNIIIYSFSEIKYFFESYTQSQPLAKQHQKCRATNKGVE